MTELSHSPAERSRKAHARVLARLQEPGSQVAIAASLGASESTISRIKNEKLADCLAFLYAAGFKLVDQGAVCIRPEALAFMRLAASHALANDEAAQQFFGEDA